MAETYHAHGHHNLYRKESAMFETILPEVFRPVFAGFAVAMTRPTFQRFVIIAVGAILCRGRRTITRIIWLMKGHATGDLSDYHRVFSRAPWQPNDLAKTLTLMILDWTPDDWVKVAIDDTTVLHKGKNVYGKGCHRDAARSTDSMTTYKYGHKWVVLAIVVRLPFTERPWALPILAALARSKKQDKNENRRHKTTGDIARILMRRLIELFPERSFVFLGDGGYASHKLASFAADERRKDHAALVSLFHGDAVLHEPPGEYSGSGAPRKKGERLPTPCEVVKCRSGRKYTVKWYGNTEREVRLISDVGHWYKSGQGLVKIRWVHVHDLTGKRDDAYYYTTDTNMRPERIVELYTWRWNIEVTFQEAKEHLGAESTRNWCKQSVLRSFPCLLGAYSVVVLMYLHHKKSGGDIHTAMLPNDDRQHVTFSDVLATVRTALLVELFEQPIRKRVFKKSKVNQDDWIKHLISLLAQAV